MLHWRGPKSLSIIMERAIRVLGKLSLCDEVFTEEQLARSVWPQTVGKRIAARTGRVSLIRSRLVVEVEDSVWQRQLFSLRKQILAKLEQALGKPLISELEFRVRAPRRPPAMAPPPPFAIADEADGILDPALRLVYKTARKKAMGHAADAGAAPAEVRRA